MYLGCTFILKLYTIDINFVEINFVTDFPKKIHTQFYYNIFCSYFSEFAAIVYNAKFG